jgi:hypothetical protein
MTQSGHCHPVLMMDWLPQKVTWQPTQTQERSARIEKGMESEAGTIGSAKYPCRATHRR